MPLRACDELRSIQVALSYKPLRCCFLYLPVGDPIEMGAVSAVLLSSKASSTRSLPLTIASDKSAVGHTEPAAGMSGLLHAAAAAAAAAALPVLHLRALNPYLIGTLEAPGIAGSVSIPRQQRGAFLSQHSTGNATGVSSFAFQVCGVLRFNSQ